MRSGQIHRKTKETEIDFKLLIEGCGSSIIEGDCAFLNHMLELFARHSRMDLIVSYKGDSEVDFHHTVEDLGIALGQCFKEAIGEKRGIKRYGSALIPMDEALIRVAIDISGRAHLTYHGELPTEKVGTLDTELIEEFFQAFVRNSDVTMHIHKLEGKNSHHIIEGMFKAFGRALREASSIDIELKDEIPSTKGVL